MISKVYAMRAWEHHDVAFKCVAADYETVRFTHMSILHQGDELVTSYAVAHLPHVHHIETESLIDSVMHELPAHFRYGICSVCHFYLEDLTRRAIRRFSLTMLPLEIMVTMLYAIEQKYIKEELLFSDFLGVIDSARHLLDVFENMRRLGHERWSNYESAAGMSVNADTGYYVCPYNEDGFFDLNPVVHNPPLESALAYLSRSRVVFTSVEDVSDVDSELVYSIYQGPDIKLDGPQSDEETEVDFGGLRDLFDNLSVESLDQVSEPQVEETPLDQREAILNSFFGVEDVDSDSSECLVNSDRYPNWASMFRCYTPDSVQDSEEEIECADDFVIQNMSEEKKEVDLLTDDKPDHAGSVEEIKENEVYTEEDDHEQPMSANDYTSSEEDSKTPVRSRSRANSLPIESRNPFDVLSDLEPSIADDVSISSTVESRPKGIFGSALSKLKRRVGLSVKKEEESVLKTPVSGKLANAVKRSIGSFVKKNEKSTDEVEKQIKAAEEKMKSETVRLEKLKKEFEASQREDNRIAIQRAAKLKGLVDRWARLFPNPKPVQVDLVPRFFDVMRRNFVVTLFDRKSQSERFRSFSEAFYCLTIGLGFLTAGPWFLLNHVGLLFVGTSLISYYYNLSSLIWNACDYRSEYYSIVDFITAIPGRIRAYWYVRRMIKNENLKKVVILIGAMVTIFGGLWLLRKYSPKKKVENREEEEKEHTYADQGWFASKDTIMSRSRLMQFLLGCASLLAFQDLKIIQKTKDYLLFFTNAAIVANGIEESCASSTCKISKRGSELCSRCRVSVATDSFLDQVPVNDSEARISKNPLSYCKRLFSDLHEGKSTVWFDKLPLSSRLIVLANYGLSPVDLTLKNYVIEQDNERKDRIWVFPIRKEWPAIDTEKVLETFSLNGRLLTRSVVGEIDADEVPSYQEAMAYCLRKGQEAPISGDIRILIDAERIFNENFTSINQGPYWAVDGDKFLFAYPIDKVEPELSYISKKKKQMDRIPFIGPWINQIMCTAFVVAVFYIAFYKIDTVSSAVDSFWTKLGYESLLSDDSDKEKMPKKVVKVDESAIVESSIPDEGKGVQGGRQVALDKKLNQRTNTQEHVRKEATNKAPLPIQKREKVGEFYLKRDAFLCVYDEPIKIINSVQGFPMVSKSGAVVYAKSVKEKADLKKKGYFPEFKRLSEQQAPAKWAMPSDLKKQTVPLVNAASDFYRGSNKIYTMSVRGTDLAEIRDEHVKYNKKNPMPPIVQDAYNILAKQVGSVERIALADAFRVKWNVAARAEESGSSDDCSKLVITGLCSMRGCDHVHSNCVKNALGHWVMEPVDEKWLIPSRTGDRDDAVLNDCPVYEKFGKCQYELTNVEKRPCNFFHDNSVYKNGVYEYKRPDESMLGFQPHKVLRTRSMFRFDVRKEGNWVPIGQAFFNGQTFVTVKHLTSKGEDFALWDITKNCRYPVIKVIEVTNHVCNDETCPQACKLNDMCKLDVEIPTARLEELKKNGDFMKIAVEPSLRAGDDIVMGWIDLKTNEPQMYNGTVERVAQDYILSDCPTDFGFSGAMMMSRLTGHIIALHKGAWDEELNRHIRFNLRTIQIINNQASTKLPKNVVTSKD